MKEKTRPQMGRLNECQDKLYDEIFKVCDEQYVHDMTYQELFEVLDRIKLAYQVDYLELEGKIVVKKKELK